MVQAYCVITSALILCVALHKCMNEVNIFHVLLTFMGLTSIAHHSRLDRWWVKDWIRAADIVAVLSTGIAGMSHLRTPLVLLWFIVQTYISMVFALIAGDFFHYSTVPMIHATTHVVVILFLLCYDTGSCIGRHRRSPK